ncbi:MAG TPA: glycosyltransferase, partial [Nitrospirota bacterium]
PNRKILSLNGSNGITVTGKVNDVVDYIKYGCVSVCPVRIGAGIQNKILESMAMGIPVVTTSLSAEGMEAINGQHFLVADDPRDFALSVIKCMLDKYLRNKIGLAARQLIETKYQWNRQLSSYISLFS